MTPEELVEIAMAIEVEDPIDWGMLAIDEKNAYMLIATSVLDQFSNMDKETMLATVTKLMVENFVLNLKLLKS